MSTLTVICPNCKHSFSADEALDHQLTEQIESKLKNEFNQKWLQQKEKLAQEALKKAQEEAEKKSGEQLELRIKQLEEEKEKQSKEVSEKLESQLKTLREENEKKAKELAEAREMEIKIRQEKNQLEEDKQKFELEKQRQLDEERKKIHDEASKKAAEEKQFEVAQLKKQLEDTQKSLEEARRKSEQVSQQLQGEVQELELEDVLRANFPYDVVEPVGKGVQGADVIQKVYDNTGKMCGIIVWESKRTKNWSEGWVQKLVDDQRKVKADAAILVSTVLPETIHKFGPLDKIFVTNFESLLGVARLVRMKVIELCYAKAAVEGKNDKKEILWGYLTGNEFKQRVEAMVETFSLMRDEMEKEKLYYTKKWAREEKQIQRIMENLLGMHGDIQGLIGTSLPEIESIELTTFESVQTVDSNVIVDTETTLTLDFEESPIEKTVIS